MWETTSLVPTRPFQVGWLKVSFLGEVEAAIMSGIKSRFVDVGLSTCDSFSELLFLFNSLHVYLKH